MPIVDTSKLNVIERLPGLKALTDGRAIIVDYPLRPDFG